MEEEDSEDERIPLIRLKVRKPEEVESASGLIIDPDLIPYPRPSSKWLTRRGSNPISRYWDPESLHYQFHLLRESFRRNFGLPSTLMAEVSDDDFENDGMLDRAGVHSHAENLYDFPKQDTSCFMPEMHPAFAAIWGGASRGYETDVRNDDPASNRVTI
jgi:hypothetical protein